MFLIDKQMQNPISLLCVCGSSKAVLAPSLTPLQVQQAKILIVTAKAVTGHIFTLEQHRNKKKLKRNTCAIPLVFMLLSADSNTLFTSPTFT